MFTARRVQASAIALTLAGTLIVDARAAADQSGDVPVYSQALANLNVALGNTGIAHYRIDAAELSVTSGGVERATTLIANNRTHKIGSQFVARDPRRGGFAELSYLVDQSDGGAFEVDGKHVVS